MNEDDEQKVEASREPTEKEKAENAGRNAAEVVAKGVANAYGGKVGGKLMGFTLKTGGGQKVLDDAGKELSNASPITRKLLANYGNNNYGNNKLDKQGGNGNFPQDDNKKFNNQLDYNGIPSDNYSSGSEEGTSDYFSQDDSNNNFEESEGKASSEFKLDGLFSNKNKLIVIGIIASIFAGLMVFMIIFITPLMSLGIIDIEGLGGSSGSVSMGYSPTKNNASYWWPTATIEDGMEYDDGDPVSVEINSQFGSRDDPFTGDASSHSGVDISSGGYGYGIVNVIASRDGTVIYPYNDSPINCESNSLLDDCGGGYGNYVIIEHNDGNRTLYAHLYEDSITVRAGATVKQGQVIGKMGSSGRSTGAHLHFEVIENGTRVDPLNYIFPDNPRPISSGGEYVEGSSNQQSVCLTLKNRGIPDNGVAGIMTNMFYESRFDPTAIGDGDTSYGLCQWHNGRYSNLMSTYPNSYQTIGSQIDFLMYELQNSYTSVYSAVMDNNMSAYDITYNFCVRFEVPADTKNTCSSRANNSSSTFSTYVNNGCQ